MTDIELIVKIHEETYNDLKRGTISFHDIPLEAVGAIEKGTPLPKGHGRLGDLDELEQRISRFVEHDAHITDEYTVARQRFIVEGIHETETIIEADKEGEDRDEI